MTARDSGMKVTYSPQAVTELRKIVGFYENSVPGLGALLVDALDRQVRTFIDSPLTGIVIDEAHRRLTLKYFPLTVICRLLPREIQVIAVAYEHQRPGDALTSPEPNDRIEEPAVRYAAAG